MIKTNLALLNEICDVLLAVTKDEFKSTGVAPELIVYLPACVLSQLLGTLCMASGNTRVTTLIEKQTIMGCNVITVPIKAEPQPLYTVCQVHCEGEIQ